jgi:hypothetical protein
MNLRGILQPSLDDIDVLIGRRDAAGRRLLECMQDVDNIGKRRRIDEPVGISSARIGDLDPRNTSCRPGKSASLCQY